MTAPGVGRLTALGFVAALGDPEAFRSGRTAAAWIGLTPRRYQSGTIDMQGRISRHGDKLLRSCLHEAAAHILRRSRADSAIRRWGTTLRERIGFKRANVAVARKLVVVLHAMWRSGRPFEAGNAATQGAQVYRSKQREKTRPQKSAARGGASAGTRPGHRAMPAAVLEMGNCARLNLAGPRPDTIVRRPFPCRPRRQP